MGLHEELEDRGTWVGAQEAAQGSEAIGLTMELGRALHAYGSSAHRLEDALTVVSRRLGLEAQFFSTPTSIFAGFGAQAEQRTLLVRIEPGEVNLEKLALLDALIAELLHGELTPAEARGRLARIVEAPPRYGAAPTAACFALTSGCAARFFGGGWREVAVSAGVGLAIGLLALLTGRRLGTARVFEPLASTLAAAAAVLCAALVQPLSIYIVTLASLIVLIPGLTLTVAITELATRNLASGTARLSGAAAVFLMIGFGVALGQKLGALAWGMPAEALPAALPAWTEALALVLAPLGFTVLFQARPADAWAILVAGVIAFLGARLGARWLGPELGGWCGALGVGLACNVYARALQRPALVPLVPGLMLLVPGSLGFRSLSALLEQDVVSGVETAFRMVLVAVGLVTGLMLASVAVPPRKAL